ncbi:MAG: ABC transporter ATP-binding protein [Anaerolineae bacterium]|nr:ABC transporter ATP-binding protein [Anaerolineae bacterium]
MQSTPKVVIQDLTVRYADSGGAGDVLAVDRVNLSVAAGEFVCIVGPSGCGKTTLLRVLTGLQLATSGSATIQRSDPARPASAMVFQGAAVFPWMTVLENVDYGLRTRGVPYAERNRVAQDWVHRMKLDRFAEAYPYQLSGGMQQRVGLARAFAYNPEVLLMDEPFGALDAQTRLLLQETLLDLWNATGNTILFVTHSIDEALTLADRVVVMSARPGRILADEAVNIPRPRDLMALRSDPHFGDLFARVWTLLRDQV